MLQQAEIQNHMQRNHQFGTLNLRVLRALQLLRVPWLLAWFQQQMACSPKHHCPRHFVHR